MPSKRCPLHYRRLDYKSRKSRNTWSNRQIWPWSTELSRAKANRVLPREHTGHSKHPLPKHKRRLYISDQIRSVAQSCLTLCDSMNSSTPGLSVHHHLLEFTETHVHRVSDAIQPAMPSSHLILCCPLLLLPPIPPSIRVFSNESTLHMRWPKYWSFSFSISPSKEHPWLISFRMDWLDPLEV